MWRGVFDAVRNRPPQYTPYVDMQPCFALLANGCNKGSDSLQQRLKVIGLNRP